MRYFQLRDDMRVVRRWVLGEPHDEHGQELDPWQFEQGRVLDLRGTLHFRQYHPGDAVDFSTAGVATPVVHGRVASLFARLGLLEQVQLFPARIEGQDSPYFVLNVLRVIRCIDDARCKEVRYYEPEDGQPEKVGEYRNVVGMRIDPELVGDAHVFRPWGWPVALIVSERLEQAMEEEKVSGVRFIEV
jgi:hypothetical protein